jgi:hypothetical protein
LLLLFAGQAAAWAVLYTQRHDPSSAIVMVGLSCAAAMCVLLLAAGLWLPYKMLVWAICCAAVLGFVSLWDQGGTIGRGGRISLALLVVGPVVLLEIPLWLIGLVTGCEFRFRPEEALDPLPAAVTTATEQETSPASGSQFRVWHLLALTAGVAAVLGLLRAALPPELWSPEGLEQNRGPLIFLLLLVLVPAACLMLAIAILAGNAALASLRGSVALAISIAVLSGGEFLAFHPEAGSHIFELLWVNAALITPHVLSLVLLRQAGLTFAPQPDPRER